MIQITADRQLHEKLLGFTQPVDICDEDGFVLARVRVGTTSNGAVRIMADPELSEKLAHFGEDVEICDRAGTRLAAVEACAPWSDPEQWEPAVPPTPEEVQRNLSTQGRTYTTAEVLEYLRNLDVPG